MNARGRGRARPGRRDARDAIDSVTNASCCNIVMFCVASARARRVERSSSRARRRVRARAPSLSRVTRVASVDVASRASRASDSSIDVDRIVSSRNRSSRRTSERGRRVDRIAIAIAMALSAGGSTAGVTHTPSSTNSEGDTHVSPRAVDRGDVMSARPRSGRVSARTRRASSSAANASTGERSAEDADEEEIETRDGVDLDEDEGATGTIDEEYVNASIERPGIAVAYGEDADAETRRWPTGSTASARDVTEREGPDAEDDVMGAEAVRDEARTRERGFERALTGGRGGAATSSSTAHGLQRPANSAADSNTAAVSSDQERPADSTEAQRLTYSRGEGEVGRTDSGLGNSEEVEGGDFKAAGSLLAAERGNAGAGAGVEVESKQIILPQPTPWDHLEPWDVPRESLVEAALELKARADAFKELGNFGTAERAYGHALRFVEQIEMFETEEEGGLSERNSQLRLECLLEASACALQRADPVRAGELAARVLAREPNNTLALKARALAAVTEGDFGTAISDLTRAMEMNPYDVALKADLADVMQRRDEAIRTPRRNAITSSFMAPPGAVSWGTMPMGVVGGTGSSAPGGKLFSYPNAGYVASGGLGMTHEVEGETDGVMTGGMTGDPYFGSAFGSLQDVIDSGAMNARALLDGTHLRRAESLSHATGAGSRMDMPDMTFNRVGGTPSVSKGTAISIQKDALQSDAAMLGDESEEDGEEVCGGGGAHERTIDE